MSTQKDWPARLTASIAGEIRRWRKARHLSAQQLSEACAKLGAEISRATLADLEAGRRAHLSVAELLVLARALDVAPVLLVCPVGAEAEAEILPGQAREPFRAAQWLVGELPFPGPGDADYLREIGEDWRYATGSPLSLYRAYDRALAEKAREFRLAINLREQAAAAASEREAQAYISAADAHSDMAMSWDAAAENLRRRAKELGLRAPGEGEHESA